MGGVVSKIVDTVVDPIGAAIKDDVDFIGETFDQMDNFVDNVHKGVIENVKGAIEGIVTGDWTKFRDSFVGLVTTAVYVVAAIYGGPAGIAAAIVALDGQYNQAQLTSYAVTTVGKVERELFGSTTILDNVDSITTAIVIVGSLYAGSTGFSTILAESSIVSSYLESYSNLVAYYKMGAGAYSVYDAYTQWQDALSLYDELMANYQQWLQETYAEIARFNNLWDLVYGDVDILYEAQPGGYLFNSEAGSDEYSISSVHEQCAYSLGLNPHKDIELDKIMTDISDIDYVSLNFNDILPDDVKYEN